MNFHFDPEQLKSLPQILGFIRDTYRTINGLRAEKRAAEETELMLIVEDALRITSNCNSANCIKTEPGTPEDRFFGKMAERGKLVRVSHGFMLPEFAPKVGMGFGYGSTY